MTIYMTDKPQDFEIAFVWRGWRFIENAFGARTSINKRWKQEASPHLDHVRSAFRKAERADPSLRATQSRVEQWLDAHHSELGCAPRTLLEVK